MCKNNVSKRRNLMNRPLIKEEEFNLVEAENGPNDLYDDELPD